PSAERREPDGRGEEEKDSAPGGTRQALEVQPRVAEQRGEQGSEQHGREIPQHGDAEERPVRADPGDGSCPGPGGPTWSIRKLRERTPRRSPSFGCFGGLFGPRDRFLGVQSGPPRFSPVPGRAPAATWRAPAATSRCPAAACAPDS